uniref:Uncharacterized protein n=1 Tax=Lepeophtheirus salmonis TaxID=72036 RepID=A0A0K2UKU8_LEPSM
MYLLLLSTRLYNSRRCISFLGFISLGFSLIQGALYTWKVHVFSENTYVNINNYLYYIYVAKKTA